MLLVFSGGKCGEKILKKEIQVGYIHITLLNQNLKFDPPFMEDLRYLVGRYKAEKLPVLGQSDTQNTLHASSL